jgi:hypothetical protein
MRLEHFVEFCLKYKGGRDVYSRGLFLFVVVLNNTVDTFYQSSAMINLVT